MHTHLELAGLFLVSLILHTNVGVFLLVKLGPTPKKLCERRCRTANTLSKHQILSKGWGKPKCTQMSENRQTTCPWTECVLLLHKLMFDVQCSSRTDRTGEHGPYTANTKCIFIALLLFRFVYRPHDIRSNGLLNVPDCQLLFTLLVHLHASTSTLAEYK